MAGQDVKENAMTGGVPARIRALDGAGNSISPTTDEVVSIIPAVTPGKKGLVPEGLLIRTPLMLLANSSFEISGQKLVLFNINYGSNMILVLFAYWDYSIISNRNPSETFDISLKSGNEFLITNNTSATMDINYHIIVS